MTEKNKTNNTGKEESQGNEFNCCNFNFEEMSKMMQNFMDEKGSFDCKEMMRQMCGEKSKDIE